MGEKCRSVTQIQENVAAHVGRESDANNWYGMCTEELEEEVGDTYPSDLPHSWQLPHE